MGMNIPKDRSYIPVTGGIAMLVKNKRIVVTGASGGVGTELVKALLNKGASVIAVSRNVEGLIKLKENLGVGDRLMVYAVDVTDKEAVFTAVEQMVQVCGTIDGLINNAGIIQPFIKVQDLPWEKIEQVMKVNFYGQLYFIKALLPELLRRPEAHIVNIASMGGFLPVPGQVIYGASKAAVKLLSEGLYAELKDTKVGVSLVLPGGINTDIAKRSGVAVSAGATNSAAAKILLSPQKAALLVIDAMEKRKLSVRIGKDSKAFFFLYKHFPKTAIHAISKFMKANIAK